jgi:hypothetical protein
MRQAPAHVQTQPQSYHPQPNMRMNQHTQPQQMRAAAPQAYHPQANMQMNQRAQPAQMRAPQQSHSAPARSNGGGHEGGGHGGHGR